MPLPNSITYFTFLTCTKTFCSSARRSARGSSFCAPPTTSGTCGRSKNRYRHLTSVEGTDIVVMQSTVFWGRRKHSEKYQFSTLYIQNIIINAVDWNAGFSFSHLWWGVHTAVQIHHQFLSAYPNNNAKNRMIYVHDNGISQPQFRTVIAQDRNKTCQSLPTEVNCKTFSQALISYQFLVAVEMGERLFNLCSHLERRCKQP